MLYKNGGIVLLPKPTLPRSLPHRPPSPHVIGNILQGPPYPSQNNIRERPRPVRPTTATMCGQQQLPILPRPTCGGQGTLRAVPAGARDPRGRAEVQGLNIAHGRVSATATMSGNATVAEPRQSARAALQSHTAQQYFIPQHEADKARKGGASEALPIGMDGITIQC